MSDLPRYLTVADVASELKISRTHAYAIVREMQHVRVGRSLRVPRVAFELYLERRTAAPPHAPAAPAPSAKPRPALRAASKRVEPTLRITQPRTKPRDT